MGDQPLVQLAGEQGDAVDAGVVVKPVAGHADLAAAGLEKDSFIEVGTRFDRLRSGGLQTGKRDRDHGDDLMRTHALPEIKWNGHLPPDTRYGGLGAGGRWMLQELVLAIGIPLLLLLLAVLALERWADQLPPWLQRLSQRPSLFWNIGFGMIIGLSLLRWLLRR